MANPIFNQFGNKNNFINGFMSEFNNFAKTIKGNPKDIVQNMLNSGEMSQEQFNQLSQQANQIMAMMPKK